MENGEGIIGYHYLHGTDKTVGDFKIWGSISSHADDGDVAFILNYQWNDVINPNQTYESDNEKANLANRYFNPADYNVKIQWRDRSVMNSKGVWTSGWMSGSASAIRGSSKQKGTRR